MDKMTKEQRHKCMVANKSKNTKPEMIVRKYLFAHGYRYRLNHPHLPGKPDIVLTKYRTAIFVNGCFWHAHEDCGTYRPPKTNLDYWQAKASRNRQRDIDVQHRLARMGWHCITVWECQLKLALREQTLASLVYTLNKIYLLDRQPKPYPTQSPSPPAIAAESPAEYTPQK